MKSLLPPALAQAIARERQVRAARTLSPLFPFLPDVGARLGTRQAVQLAFAHTEAQAWEAELLRQAGAVQRYLGWDYAQLCEEAKRIPRHLVAISGANARRLLRNAERLFGELVPGVSVSSQVARALDPRYWRRTLWRRIGQAKEKLHLELKLIGKGGRAYCSEEALNMRGTQLARQRKWLKETVLRANVQGERVELALEAIAKTPRQRLSRLYAFIAAIDRLAVEEGLSVALLTATLEGAWHPNPTYSSDGWRWNGKTPEQASRELAARFQRVRRDLDKKGIAVSGLWATEPHKDGCPHRHFWLVYAPEHEGSVFAAFQTHFPGKLKVRRDEDAGGDVMYDTREDAQEGRSRPLTHEREGAQVDVSVIDRKKGSGASYVLKYVSKAIGAEAAFGEADTQLAQSAEERRRQQHNLQAIDAYRAVWRMRGCQFFGIRNCLTLWDELRRVKEPPVEAHLRALWRAARGGEARGPLKAGGQRSDAYTFLKLQGGLAAARKPAQGRLQDAAPAPQARIYSSARLTQYGEAGARIEGVELVACERGAFITLERVATRAMRWELVPRGKVGKASEAKVPGRRPRGIVNPSLPSKATPRPRAGAL